MAGRKQPPHRAARSSCEVPVLRLTRERVVDAALAIVDRDGLEGLTMRSLGYELRVDPMAAYHWFPNKQAILQGIGEAILADLRLPAFDPASPWPDVVRSAAHAYRAALLRHPNALPVAATQPVLTPRGLAEAERILAALVAGGLSPGAALETVNTSAALVIGLTMAQAGVTTGPEPLDQGEIVAAYAGLDPEQLPVTVAALSEAMARIADASAQFEAALEVLILGLQATHRSPNETDATRRRTT